tara:strand:+ start:8081 stop:9619 length:1539 start_codon:yes stop_codon:yes gene_type:complete
LHNSDRKYIFELELNAMSDEYKKIQVEFKEGDEEKGKVAAVFSLFNDIDTDGDVVLPQAIKSGFDKESETVPMVWAHQWDKPIGKGKIVKDEEKAIFDGEFFMDTESGAEAYKLVKNMGNLQQWSFGFRVNDSEYGKFAKSANDEEQDVRYLKDLSVYEVSPVLVGANQETFTMAIKSQKDDTDQKGVLSHDSIQKEDPEEEEKGYGECDYDKTGKCAKEGMKEEKAKPTGDMYMSAEEAEDRAKQLGCSGSHTHDADGQIFYMPCATHEDYDKVMGKTKKAMEVLNDIALNMKDILKEVPTDQDSLDLLNEIAKKMSVVKGEEVLEDRASVQGKRFSDEVKDVLAALNSLVARVQSIGELRQKNGRKLGVSATEALRAVQESVSDAFAEIDKFVDEFGSEGDLSETAEVVNEVEVEETEVQTEPVDTTEEEPKAEETVEAQAEVETVVADPEPEVDTGDERTEEDPIDEAELPTEEVLDDELDKLWLESQEILTDSILVDVEVQDNEIIEE